MYTDITTVEEAYKKHPGNLDLSMLSALSKFPGKFSRGMSALFSLQVITEVVNNDDPAKPVWEADYNNDDQEKWFPWYRGGDSSGSGFRFLYSHYAWTNTSAGGGARLALKDEARSDHMDKYFRDLYKELYLILK